MPDVRLIDANALIKTIKGDHCKGCNKSGFIMCRVCTWMDAMDYIEDAPTIDAQPAKPMNGKAHWTDTDETVWEARNKDSGEEFEISIVAAKCSFCGRWAEQVNTFPPYMKYEYCPHCSRKMDIKR